MALLAKPVVVTLPPTILILIWWKRGRVGKDDLLSVAPMLALGLAAALVAVHVEHRYGGATGAAWQLSALERILVAGRAVWFYAGKLAWPVNLLSVYPRWQVNTSAWWQYLYPVGAAALLGVLWHWRGRFGRGPLAAVLCFGVLVSPLVGIFNVAYHLYSFVADHFQYHAAPALFALFASGVVRLRSWNGRALAAPSTSAPASSSWCSRSSPAGTSRPSATKRPAACGPSRATPRRGRRCTTWACS